MSKKIKKSKELKNLTDNYDDAVEEYLKDEPHIFSFPQENFDLKISIDSFVDIFTSKLVGHMSEIEHKLGRESRKLKFFELMRQDFEKGYSILKELNLCDRRRLYKD